MEKLTAVLLAIRDNEGGAADLLRRGLDDGGPEFLIGLAAFLYGALHGVVIDPEDL